MDGDAQDGQDCRDGDGGDRLGCGWAGIGRDGDGPDGQDSWDGKGPG